MYKSRLKKILVWMMCFTIILSSVPLEGISFAATTVTSVLYNTKHNGYDMDTGYLEIHGTELADATIYLRDTSNELFIPETITSQTDNIVLINLSTSETTKFKGDMLVGAIAVDLELGTFPTISSGNSKNINYGDSEDYIVYGNNLDQVKTDGADTGVVAEFGKVQKTEFYNAASAPGTITITDPIPPGGKGGLQDLYFTRTTSPGGVTVNVTYQYEDVFRLVDNVGLNTPEMFPNMGAHGDTVYVTSDNFNSTKNYALYFLKDLAGGDDYNDVNRGVDVALSIDIDGTTEDRLTVEVPPRIQAPDDPAFDIGTYYVVLVNEAITEENGVVVDRQIIAEQILRNPDGSGDPDEYTIIESSFNPQILSLNPNSGTDNGTPTTIEGSNILEVDLPSLVDDNTITGITTETSDTDLVISYNNGEYNGKDATIKRTIKIQIGKLVTFDAADYNTGLITDELLRVTTGDIPDTATDPVKDVQVEIETEIVETGVGGGTAGKTYLFRQTATLEDGFTFIPSTLTPSVDSVTPGTIQMAGGTPYNVKQETLMVIKGDDFMVDRIVEDDGTVITRKPTVLLKKDETRVAFDVYQVGFFPSDTVSGVTGVIRLQADEQLGPTVVLSSGATPTQLDLTVLDDDNNVVDGTTGNDIGTKIVIRIPDTVTTTDIGVKQIQVINPERGSSTLGGYNFLIDEMRFITSNDNPAIESVEPNIVTIDGGEEIVITGTNFQEGLSLYLDGNEITDFVKDKDALGIKDIITFTAPAGREGTTQLQVINPSGGMDVRDFIYVQSFNNDPVITNFTPTRGTADTLVLINGENYLQPITSVADTLGVNGLRLIGTRVYLDGEDVNEYNKTVDGDIEFKAYTSPDSDYVLLKRESDQALWSAFENNVTLTKDGETGASSVFYISNDSQGDPMITNKDDESYTITYDIDDGNYYATSEAVPNPSPAAVVTITQPSANETRIAFTIDGTAYAFTGAMDNNLIRQSLDDEGEAIVRAADYAESIILTDGTNYYTLSEDFDGDVIFTNNSNLEYTLGVNAGVFFAKEENKPSVAVTVTNTTLTIDGTAYTYITPYIFDEDGDGVDDNLITGDRTKIINGEQISFIVPTLETGTGYKDLKVINPDTRSDEKVDEAGFYYIQQSSSHPVISDISPNKGSIAGGYVITISGSDFEDDMKVFIDSVEVPQSDTYVALDGSYVTVKVPACIKDLQGDYGVDEMDVPVVVLNEDGGSAYKEDGFKYVVPVSTPRIDQVILTDGSSNGGEIVEIIGYDFRYFEPYTDVGGSGPGYNPGDDYDDLYKNEEWDDLLDEDCDPDAVRDVAFSENALFTVYKESEILPTVFFGENEAKIVEYAKGYIKVISPAHDAGTVPLYVVNNDQGVSNSIDYTYTASVPTITELSPAKGNRTGQELKDIYGTNFFRSELQGYAGDDPDAIVTLTDVEANVRFGDIDNREVETGEANYGQINGGRADVVLDGDLRASYNGSADTITLYVEENGKIYTRTFNNYDDSKVYLPMEMLMNGTDHYYPNGYTVDDTSIWNDNIYEYIQVSIEDRRFIVERGYAPKVEFISSARLTATSPSYHTIDDVPLTVTNNDGGQATATFTYTNPDSKPTILHVNPYTKTVDGTYYQVEGSIQGGIQIEVVGLDFRTGVKAYIGTDEAEIVEDTTTVIDDVTYDVLILTVPAGTTDDIDQRYPIIVENTDDGMANSTTLTDLIGPNDGANTLPFYFVYRKPLSGPVITSVEPEETSIYGGNTVVITGTDFRTDALVIIGTSGGVPVSDGVVSNEGQTLTITTPEGMTLGDKTIQVINADFGTGSLDNALTIVSFPTVEEEILNEDGSESFSTASVEGGEVITVKGTDFHSGARVFFGSTRTSHDEKPEEGDVIGLFRDDTYIVLTDGYEATSVTVVDENTMLVTTPEITKEDTFNITVINEDGGISEDNADMEFSEPVPTRPVDLKARVVDDRYIQLYDYTSEGVEYYEVYYYLGSKNTSEVGKNDREAMRYLGTTTLEPYKVNRIPGFDDRQPGDVLYFSLKAVNMYGISKWSNYATLNFNQLEDVEELGPEDIDGELGQPSNQDYLYSSDGDTSVINLSAGDLGREVIIDLNGIEEGDPGTRIINVPQELVKDSQTLIQVDYLDSKLQFIPVGLNTQEFRELGFYDRAYGRITTSTAGNSYNSMLKLSLPRGKKTATRILTLDVEAMNNEESKVISNFSAPIDIQIAYDDNYLTAENEADLQLYRYDKSLDKWELMSATIDTDKNLATVRTNKPGSFVVLYNR